MLSRKAEMDITQKTMWITNYIPNFIVLLRWLSQKNFYGQLDDTDREHNKTILDAAGDIAWRLRTNALFGLCDAAFGNYKFTRESSKMFVRNGAVLGDGIDPEQYRNMYNDLVKVFIKYAGGGSYGTVETVSGGR